MIIEKIRIGGFGKFKDFECKLYKGLQIIYGKNESGKSTIMDFIMLMFYSRLSGEKAGKRDKGIRQKYLPWDGGKMFGTIEFLYNNEKYLLTKEFHADTPNKDKTIFKNLSVGESINLRQREEIGERLFDLDLRGFERSGFIKNIGLDVFNNISNKKDSLSDKIFKMVTGQEQENISEGLVIRRLDGSIKELEKNKGKIDIYENEIYDIKNKIFKLNQQIKSQDNYRNYLATLENKIRDKNILKEKLEYCILLEKLNNLKELKLYLKNIEDIKKDIVNEKITYENFLLFFNRLKDLKGQISRKEKILSEFESLDDDVRTVPEGDFNIFEKAILEKQKLKDAVFSISNTGIEKLSTNKQLMREVKDQIGYTCKNIKLLTRKIFISKLFLVIGGLIGIGIGLVLKNIFWGFLLGSVFSLICFLVYKNFNSKFLKLRKDISDSENTFDELSYKNEKSKSFLKTVLSDIGIICDESQYGDILGLLNNKIVETENIASVIFKKYDCKCERDFEILYFKSKNKSESLKKSQKMKREIENLKDEFLFNLKKIFKKEALIGSYAEGCEKYNYIFNRIEKLENLENIVSSKSRFINIDEFNTEEIDNVIVSTSENFKKYKYGNLNIDKNEAAKNLKILENEKLEEKYYEIKSKINLIDSDPQSLEILLKSKCDKLSDIKDCLKSLKIAKQVFEEAVKEIRKDVIPLLDLRASEIFARLTDKKYNFIHIQKDYTLFVNDNISYTFLSSSTIDQAYLSLRIAMSEIISKNNHIPFFMDDILMQYDNYRLEVTFKFLKDFFDCEKKCSQAIIFTCHNNFLELANDYGCNTVYL